jgi:hypothetical protein
MNRLATLVLLNLSAVAVTAFAPNNCKQNQYFSSPSELSAVNRRDVFGLIFGGTAVVVASSIVPENAHAVNPALETFKGGKKTKGSFIPGKGLRDHESFDTLVAANPALETFKGGKSTKGSFIPGKGIRNHDDTVNEQLLAANPALETFKGRKRTRGSFTPGKGIRRNGDITIEEFIMSKNINNNFDTLIAANPALETFKGRKRTRGSFTPGKG